MSEIDMTADHTAVTRDFSAPLASCKGWMKFLGIVFIVEGALTALTIIGIILAWLPIWIGVLLLQSASSLERANVAGDEAAFRMAMSKLRTYFVIQGVMMLVGICLFVLMMFIDGAMMIAMLSHAHNM